MDDLKDLKKVMRSSFNESFFVVKRDSISEKYLELLIDMVIARFNLERNDYIKVADRICEYDSRIQLSYSEWEAFIAIPLLKHSDRFVDLYYKWACSFCCEISEVLLRRLQKIITDKKNLFTATIIYLVIQNYIYLSPSDKEVVLFLIEATIDEHMDTSLIKSKGSYDVMEIDADVYQDLLYQMLIYNYCKLKGLVFNFQTPHSIKVFNYLDKEKMYFDIRESMLKGFSESSSGYIDEYGVVLSKFIGHNITIPTDTVNDYGMLDYYYEWITSDRARIYSLIKVILEILNDENDIFTDLLASHKELSFMKKENIELLAKIEELNISIDRREHELVRIIHQNENIQKKLLKQIDISESEKNELHALRELLFTLGANTPEIITEPLHMNTPNINCDEIVVIGGHIKWIQKLKEYLPSISVVSADQKCVDVNFIRNKKFILFFINYLSHSLYLNVISKIRPEQKIGFIKKRNIADVVDEIRNLCLK